MVRAVTLIELLIAVCLFSLVALAGGALYTTATSFFTTLDAQAKMQNQANIALQEMTRNIYLADDVTKISDSEIEVTPSSGLPFRYRQVGSNIRRNGQIIAYGVRELRFSDITTNPQTQRKYLQINLTMQGAQGLVDLQFISSVTLRWYE